MKFNFALAKRNFAVLLTKLAPLGVSPPGADAGQVNRACQIVNLTGFSQYHQPFPAALFSKVSLVNLAGFLILALGCTQQIIAAPALQTAPVIQLTVNPHGQPAIAFEAKQAKLGDILKQFAEKTGATIHHSVLPEEPVTATCAGDSVKQVMECLLGNKVDRVYRKVNNAEHRSRLTKAAVAKEEIWILGTRYGNSGNMSCTLDASQSRNPELATNESDALPQQALIKMAQIISDPRYAQLGKQALSMLAAQGKTGDANTDAEIVNTLEKALQDKNPEARAQAVFGLSQQDSNNTEVLHEALQDSNSDVRLMAVDSAKADTPQGRAVLSEALNDNDETVRALAEQKLRSEANEQ